MGSMLNVVHNIDLYLREKGIVDSSAYWISDSKHYLKQQKKLKLLLENQVTLLFEWDYTTDVTGIVIDSKKLEQMEEKFGDPYLWNAIVADRRLTYGYLCKIKQDYNVRFSHEQLQVIVYQALLDLEKLFDSLKPDLIVLPTLSTFGDYLLYLVAKRYAVPFFFLRSTKIYNYVALSETIDENPEHIYEQYRLNMELRNGYPKEEDAIQYLESVDKGTIQYEGNVSSKPQNSIFLQSLYMKMRGLLAAIRSVIRDRNQIAAKDNHLIPSLSGYIHGTLLKEYRGNLSRRLMARRSYSVEKMNADNYIFYPMHAEPEISLSVFGRDHQNQIETVRRMSQSIPLSWKLVIKEHPRNTAYRSKGYYEALLNIPNVYFANPDKKPMNIISSAKAVVVVSGFVGFEALLLGTPVIVLGNVSYSVLPDTMVCKVSAMNDFSSTLLWLIKNFKKDDAHLKAYIAAVMTESIPVNLYSDLLKKSNRISYQSDSVQEQIILLSDYLITRFKEVSTKACT